MRRATSVVCLHTHLTSDFNPRSPWGERPSITCVHLPFALFQSTLSVRRATNYPRQILNIPCISIHALREESDAYEYTLPKAIKISIHALREESDNLKNIDIWNLRDFNPRSPWGERPLAVYIRFLVPSDFNPRSPWGERLCIFNHYCLLASISIHALREESDKKSSKTKNQLAWISIHALREESDLRQQFMTGKKKQFQSTLSVRRATWQVIWLKNKYLISIHALREESDECDEQANILWLISIHALREESDKPYFYSTALIF